MITIYSGFMEARLADGEQVGSATRQPDGLWDVTADFDGHGPVTGALDRNRAISALMLAQAYRVGFGDDDPEVQALRLELDPNWRHP